MSGAVPPPLYAFMVCEGITCLMSYIFLWKLRCLQRGTLCVAVCRSWHVDKLKMAPNLALLNTWRNFKV